MRARTVLALAAAGAVAVIVVPSCLPLRDAVEDGPGVAGVYVVNGVDTSGNEYSGTVEIRTGDAGAVELQWVVTGAIQEGRGTLRDDHLVATWHTVSGSRPDAAGTASYTVVADGTLTGERTIDGVAGVATEQLFLEP